jgi:hypothetical protein
LIGQFDNPCSFKATGSRTSFRAPCGPITGNPYPIQLLRTNTPIGPKKEKGGSSAIAEETAHFPTTHYKA